jgi:GNAT superfamily N-acetyltransferase
MADFRESAGIDMNEPTAALHLLHHTTDVKPTMKHQLIAVHIDARAELLAQPFYAAERFAQRLDEHVKEPGFELVTGHIGNVLVGYAYGSTLPTDTWFWTSLEGIADPDITRETGDRTFWLRELLVRKDHQRRGHARRLLDALLAGRTEERAVLFVRSDNPARRHYEHWGWSIIGNMPPQPGIPEFEAMLAELTGRNAHR